MQRPANVGQAISRLSRIGSGPIDEGAVAELKRAIQGRAGLLAAGAAEIAADRGLRELIPDMILAFDRFMADGAHTDKQCIAKIAIVKALNALEYVGDEVFLPGARYVQMEPVFGGREDTAVEVRIGCAFGLARTEHPETLYVLTDLLLDPERGVRSAAARALAYLGRPESEMLLRLKALTGDREPEVVGECLTGLMTMAPEPSLDFVAGHLDSYDSAIAQLAALALGGSRLSRAYEKLREGWENDPSPTARRALLVPIALIRSDAAFDFLVEVVRTSAPNVAADAIRALGLYRSEENVGRLREVVASRQEPQLTKAFDAEFRSHIAR